MGRRPLGPYACIDIGSNTTRLLVAACRRGRLHGLANQCVYTRIGKDLPQEGKIARARVARTAETVADQARAAREAGASEVVVVATAAVRAASNGAELVEAIEEAAGLSVRVISAEEEARLAFAGATNTVATPASEKVAVIDVGGGSTEIAIGTAGGDVSWWGSIAVGSGVLTDRHLRTDPPTAAELSAARAEVANAMARLAAPHSDRAMAVGGSARSLRRVVGEDLTKRSVTRALDLLAVTPAAALADRCGLDPERARLLPGGALIIEALLERVSGGIAVASGGLREGIVLELASARSKPAGRVGVT